MRAHATALACSLPQAEGRVLSRWSLAEIAARMSPPAGKIGIAPSTLSRWFRADRLKPWQYHHWQHILDPHAFLERARPVLQLYDQAQTLLEQGIWVVCSDEKTSIQARELEQTPRAAISGWPMHVSPRYTRRGAVQLFAGLSVADGQKYGQVFPRKRFVDFQAFLLETLIPEALRRGVHTVKLILDNGSTHAPKQLQNWLDAQTQQHGWPLRVEVIWLPRNASWLDQIEIWFSVLTRKLLKPNHFQSVDALTRAILDFIRCENRSARPIHWTYTVEKLEKKLGTL